MKKRKTTTEGNHGRKPKDSAAVVHRLVIWLLRFVPVLRGRLDREIRAATKPKPMPCGLQWLSHQYNDPGHERSEDESVPRSVFVVYGDQIKRAVLMRVPKPVDCGPFVGLVGLIDPCMQTFIPMYRVCDSIEDAHRVRDAMLAR